MKSGKMSRFGDYAYKDSLIWSSMTQLRTKSVMQSWQRSRLKRLRRQRPWQRQQVDFFQQWDSVDWKDLSGVKDNSKMNKIKLRMHRQRDQGAKRQSLNQKLQPKHKAEQGSIRHLNLRVRQWGFQKFLHRTSSSTLQASLSVTSSI